MSIATLPFASRLVIGCLLDTDAVTDLVGSNIGTDNPRTPEAGKGIVRVSQFAGRIVSGGSIYWLETTPLQLDCWGPGGSDRLVSYEIAEECRRALVALRGDVSYVIGSDVVTGVVTGVDVGGIQPDNDEAFEPAKPYAHFDAVLTAHPSPDSGS